jgi:hypothetical protein
MDINITFLIQIINFGITYFFLNKILFRPVVYFLQKREILKQRVISKIAEKERDLDTVYSKKAADMLHFQSYLAKKYRFTKGPLLEIPLRVTYQKDPEGIELLVQKGSALVLKEVGYACKL